MKLTIERRELAAALSAVAHAATTKATLPVLGMVRLSCDGKLLHLTCTDLDVSLETAVACRRRKPGVACVPAAADTAIVRNCRTPTRSLALNGGKLSIQSGAVSFDLLALDAAGVPERARGWRRRRAYGFRRAAVRVEVRGLRAV